jgi:hypothetical protein
MKIGGWIFIIRGVEDTRHKQLFIVKTYGRILTNGVAAAPRHE